MHRKVHDQTGLELMRLRLAADVPQPTPDAASG